MTSADRLGDSGFDLCLSGGGWRAMLFHCGVIAALRKYGKLGQVRRVFAVSGGAVLAGDLALNWMSYVGSDDEFVARLRKMVQITRRGVRNRVLAKRIYAIVTCSWWWKANELGRLLAAEFRWLWGEGALGDVGSSGPLIVLVATALDTGRFVAMSRDGVTAGTCAGDIEEITRDRLEVAVSVAASAAYPAAFKCLWLDGRDIRNTSRRYDPFGRLGPVTDGGVWDNSGLSVALCMQDRSAEAGGVVCVVDAGASFDERRISRWAGVAAVSRRALECVMRRAASGPQGQPADKKVVDIKLSWDTGNPAGGIGGHVARVRTDFDVFTDEEITDLLLHGYLAGAAACGEERLDELRPTALTWIQEVRRSMGISVRQVDGVWQWVDSWIDSVPERTTQRVGSTLMRAQERRWGLLDGVGVMNVWSQTLMAAALWGAIIVLIRMWM